jgi:hypothetical protein
MHLRQTGLFDWLLSMGNQLSRGWASILSSPCCLHVSCVVEYFLVVQWRWLFAGCAQVQGAVCLLCVFITSRTPSFQCCLKWQRSLYEVWWQLCCLSPPLFSAISWLVCVMTVACPWALLAGKLRNAQVVGSALFAVPEGCSERKQAAFFCTEV